MTRAMWTSTIQLRIDVARAPLRGRRAQAGHQPSFVEPRALSEPGGLTHRPVEAIRAESRQTCQARLDVVEPAREIFERQRRHRLREAGEHRRLAAFDVDFDEGRHAESRDQSIERRHLNVDTAIPAHAGEVRVARSRVAPLERQRRHRGCAFADRQRGLPGRIADRRLDDLDARRAGEQRPQHGGEIRLRLDRDDAATERGQRADAIPDVGADVEDEIARCDELCIQATQTPLTQRNRVIDRERTQEADGPVEPTHRPARGSQAARSSWQTITREEPLSTCASRRASQS